MNILLGLGLVILVRSVRSLTSNSERFRVLNGFRMSSGYKKSVYNVFGRRYCAVMCLQATKCHSANFDTATNTCELNMETPTEETTLIVEEENWECVRPAGLRALSTADGVNDIFGDAGKTVLQLESVGGANYILSLRGKGTCDTDGSTTTPDIWRLVFRATAGIGIAVYDSWIGSVSLPDAPDSCKLTQSSGCMTHYRSSVLDHWTANNIKQVKFSLYKNNIIVVSMLFKNFAEDNNCRWYSKDRLINSSYSDMTPTSYYNFFSAPGYKRRRFYISHSWNLCPKDIGWITVYDDPGVCPYENGLHYPYFAYAPNNQKGNSLDFLSADVLAVFINQD